MMIRQNPLSGPKTGTRSLPKVLSEDSRGIALFDAAADKLEGCQRHVRCPRSCWKMLYAGGLRVSELVTPASVFCLAGDNPQFIVVGKGNRKNAWSH